MPKEKVMELEGVLNQLRASLELGDKQLQEAVSSGDTATAQKLAAGLQASASDYNNLLPQYEQAYQERQNELVEGLDKYKFGFKEKKVMRNYAPAMNAPIYEATEYEFDPKDGHKQLQGAISELLGVPTELVDTKRGINYEEMALVKSMTSPEARADTLASLYGGQAYPIKVGGSENFVVKTEGGGWKLAFPPDKSGKALGAAAQAKAFPVGAAILGGAFGMKVGGKASIPVSAGGGNLAYSLAEKAQESVLATGSRLPIGGRKTLGSMAKDVAIGTAIETAVTPVIGKITRGMAAQAANKVDQQLMAAAKTLDTTPYAIPAPKGAAAGYAGLQTERFLAAEAPESTLAQSRDAYRRTMRTFQESMSGMKEDLTALRKGVFDNVKRKYEAVANAVSKKDRKIGQLVQKLGERRFNALAVDGQNQAKLGESVRGLVEQAEVGQRQIADQSFSGFYGMADQAGVRFTKQEVLDTVRGVLQSDRNKFLGSKGVQEAMREVANATENEFSYQSLRNIIKKVQDSATDMPVGAPTSPQVATAVAGALRDVGEAKIAQAGLGDAWRQTLKTYDESVLAFNRSAPGAILAEKLGASKLSGSDVVARALKDEQTATDVLDALYKSGDQASAAQLHKGLQDAYLERIGLFDRFGKAPGQVEPKKSMIEALWGRNPDGTPNPLAAQRVESSIREMNQAFEAAKVKVSDLTPDDLGAITGIVSQNERKEIIDQLVKRSKIAQEETMLAQNELVQLAKKGNWQAVDNDEFAEALFNARTSDVQQVFGQMSPMQKATARKDFMYHFFNKYNTAGQGTNQIDGFDLWDGDAFIKDLGNWERGRGVAPRIVKNMDAVIGRDATDQIIAVSRMNKAYAPMSASDQSMFRTMMSGTGIKIYAAGAPSFVKNRFLAAAYGSERFSKLMRQIISRKDPDSVRQIAEMVGYGLVGTRPGWLAMASATRNDPDAQAAVNEMLQNLSDARANEGQ